jgi:hypothetical protein
MKKPKNEFFNPIKMHQQRNKNKAHVFSMKFFISDISTTLDFLDAINFNWIDNPWAKQLFRKKRKI